MKLLAIETATDACSVALDWDGEVRVVHRNEPRRHADLVLPAVANLLSTAGGRLSDLDAIAFGRGPGSFTGVRIAAAVCQGLAFGADLPVVSVSTLAAVAQGQFREKGAQRILVAVDARMAEVYFAAFGVDDDGLVGPLSEELVCAPAAVPRIAGEHWAAAGSGWRVHAEPLRARYAQGINVCEPDRLPDARDTLALGGAGVRAGRAVAPEQALPVYLRDRVTRPGAGG